MSYTSASNALKKLISCAAAAVMTFTCFGAAVSAYTLPVEESQVVNPEPATFESLGVDKEAKKAFEDSVAKNTKLPVINITTQNNSELILSKELYTSCVVDVFNCDDKLAMSEVSAGIRVRGNSSAYYGDVEQIKKNPVPYRIKFDKKQNMLGLNGGAKCKSWVLLKSDWNLIANDFAFRLGRAIIGDDTYCSDSTFVHVYVNDKFQDTYLLCEQNQVNKNRVDVTEPEEGYEGTDIGYYLELDNYAWEPGNYFVSMDYDTATVTDIRGETRQFVPAEYTIKNDLYSSEQVDFISKYLQNVFTIVYQACEKGRYYTFDDNYDLVKADYTTAEETVSAVMDVQSVADLYLLYESVHDYDCGEGSFYMCADFAPDAKITKLTFTSPWDFNWAYNDSADRYWAGAFCEKSFVSRYGDRSNPWFIVLAKQDWFTKLASDRWTELVNGGIIEQTVNDERAVLAEYADDLNKNKEGATDAAEGTLGWIDQRMRFMNGTFSRSLLKGDINNDGKVDTKDAMLSISYARKKRQPEAGRQFNAADHNGDTVLDTKDSMRIIKAAKKGA